MSQPTDGFQVLCVHSILLISEYALWLKSKSSSHPVVKQVLTTRSPRGAQGAPDEPLRASPVKLTFELLLQRSEFLARVSAIDAVDGSPPGI